VTHDGAVLRVILNAPKGNILNDAMMRELTEVLVGPAKDAGLKALIIEGAGPNFSFGASVEEHAPKNVRAMLLSFHELFRKLASLALPTVAVVRGRCLGGGLELASFASLLFASEDAQLGQPEIRLGVIAPMASLVLPMRVGQRAAERLLISGETIDARRALALGLVDAVSADPEKDAFNFIETNLLPSSASSLRFATRAARRPINAALERDLPALESLYLEELMQTHDAVEGIEAFLHKRPAKWRNA
jgi:cyclohexa-1,5-dienecarbonyl-CoA hydratase